MVVLVKGPLNTPEKRNGCYDVCVNLQLPVLDLVCWAVLAKVGTQLLFRVLPSTFIFVSLIKVNAFMIQEFVVH